MLLLRVHLLQVWRHVQHRGRSTQTWEEAHVLVCSTTAGEAQPRAAGGVRRRVSPVPLVNQVCWTIDDIRVSGSKHSILKVLSDAIDVIDGASRVTGDQGQA